MTTELHADSIPDDRPRPGEGTPIDSGPHSTGSPATRALGIAVLAGFAMLAYLGLAGTPEDQVQGELVRLLYVHPQSATVAYLGCFFATTGSVMYLWKRSVWWDLVAHATAEIGAVFTAFALITGMLWGRPSWGTYWVWDARLTSTAMLMLLLLGYLALRKLPGDPDVRARQSAIVGLLLVPNVILVRQSVTWWRTLHQAPTLSLPGAQIEGLLLFTMMFGFAVFSGLFLWLTIHRFRVAWLARQVDELAVDEAITARIAEGTPR